MLKLQFDKINRADCPPLATRCVKFLKAKKQSVPSEEKTKRLNVTEWKGRKGSPDFSSVRNQNENAEKKILQ